MDDPTVDVITRLIGNLGFPIFIAVWLLWRTDALLKELIEAIKQLQHTLKFQASPSRLNVRKEPLP